FLLPGAERQDVLLRLARDDPAPARHRSHEADVPAQRHRSAADGCAWGSGGGGFGVITILALSHLPGSALLVSPPFATVWRKGERAMITDHCRTIPYTELPPAQPGNPLATEWELFRREVGRLLAEGHEGKTVLIKDDNIIGIY